MVQFVSERLYNTNLDNSLLDNIMCLVVYCTEVKMKQYHCTDNTKLQRERTSNHGKNTSLSCFLFFSPITQHSQQAIKFSNTMLLNDQLRD